MTVQSFWRVHAKDTLEDLLTNYLGHGSQMSIILSPRFLISTKLRTIIAAQFSVIRT